MFLGNRSGFQGARAGFGGPRVGYVGLEIWGLGMYHEVFRWVWETRGGFGGLGCVSENWG